MARSKQHFITVKLLRGLLKVNTGNPLFHVFLDCILRIWVNVTCAGFPPAPSPVSLERIEEGWYYCQPSYYISLVRGACCRGHADKRQTQLPGGRNMPPGSPLTDGLETSSHRIKKRIATITAIQKRPISMTENNPI
jgi:hypothetical protein